MEVIPEDSLNDKVPKVQNFEKLETFAELKSLDICSSKSDADLDLSIVSRNEIDDSIISEAEHLVDSIKPKNADEQIAHIEKYIEHFKAASKNWLDSYKKNVLQESPISEKSLKKYIKLELSISSIYSNWGYQLSTLHNYEEAIAKFEEAGTIIEKLTNLFKVGSKNKLHSCYKEVNKGYRINKQLSGIYKNWGFALSRLGRFQDAVDKYKNAQKENPKNDLAYKNLGFALSRLGKDAEAIQSYKEALKYCRDSSKIRIYIGFSHTVLGQFAEAIDIYESIVNDESQEISIKCDAYYEWANTLDEKGDSEGAMKKLDEALNLQESSDKQSKIKLLNRLGLLHYHKKEYKKAQELFEEIIDDDSNYGFAYINQGLVHNQKYHECKDDIDTYQRTLTEIRNILKNLETNKENGLLKWDDQKEKYDFYDKAINIIQKSSYLRHDYIDIYEREAKKIENRLSRCKKEEEDLRATFDKMKTGLSKPKNVDQKYDLNASLLANSLEMQSNPLGF